MYDPAAMPEKHVESNSAKAGARSEEARTRTRNQAISYPSATKPEIPAINIESDNGTYDSFETAATRISSSGAADSRSTPRASRATIPMVAFRMAANNTEPDCPSNRRRNVAHR